MSNIPTLQWLVDLANVGIIIALAASLIFGGASILLSRRLSTLRDDRSAREKHESDEKIETTKADAARIEGEGKERVAKVEAEAKEKIAGVTREAETLRAEAESAKAERAEADKQIAIAKADAAKAQKETATISLRVEEESRKRAEAEAVVLAMRLSQAPRRLTAEQRADLLKYLPPGRDLTLVIVCRESVDDKEVTRYARDFTEVFEEKGWKVQWLGVGLPPPAGPITVRYSSLMSTGVMKNLFAAFEIAGLHFIERVTTWSGSASKTIELTIPVQP